MDGMQSIQCDRDIADLWYIMFSMVSLGSNRFGEIYAPKNSQKKTNGKNFRPGSIQCHHGRLVKGNVATTEMLILYIIHTVLHIYIYMICIYTDYFYDLYIYIPIPPTYTDMSLYK